jgi:predicted rRNA methylase
MKSVVIYNPSPQELEVYSNLRSRKETDHFIAESEKIITRLLRSNLEIESLYLTEEHFNSKKDLIEAHLQQSECKIFIASKEEMAEIVGFKLHQGILAAAKIPKERTLDELIADSKKPLLFIILDEVADAENMGAIFRTSFAMDATAVIIDKKSVSPWMRRSVRVSMGAIFELPVITVESIPDCIKILRAKNITSLATTLNDSVLPIWNADLTKDCAIVFGSEGHGIKKEIIEMCDREVTIPMRDNLHSLNVGTAHGIFLYEVLRQRGIN